MDENQSKGAFQMSTTVQKWGNSLGVRIPRKIAEEFNIVNGTEIEFVMQDEGILLKPIIKEPTLEELMSTITADNKHKEIDFGKPKGKEQW